MKELTVYILNANSEYVQVPSPLAYTKDISMAARFVFDLGKPTDDLIDEAENGLIRQFKKVVANDGNPDQHWELLCVDDSGSPYYRIDILDSSKMGTAYKANITRVSEADAFCAALRDLLYDCMLDIFGPQMLKNTVQSTLNQAKNALSGGASFSQTDDVDKIVQEIQEKTQAEIVKPSENMDDYVCDDSLKEQLLQIVDFFDNRTAYSDAGIEIPKGVLFKGPPGTGKTYAARCIAGTVDCYFMACTASSLQGMYIGSGASNIKAVFKGARLLAEKSNKGVIVFMDEIDSMGSRGSTAGAGDEVNRTINQLLAEMSGFDSKDNVMVMAATNFPDLIDPALLRSGRFSRQITIDYPDDVQRESMIRHYSSKLQIPVGYDMAEATALTKTFTPADIKEAVNSAAIKTVRSKRKQVSLDDLNEAINEVISKDIRKPDNLKSLHLVTAHECGHVLTEVLLKGTVPTKVTNYAYGDAGGFTQPSEILTGIVKESDISNEVMMLLGGRAAEQICLGYVTTGASNDLEKAKHWLKRYYSTYHFKAYDTEKLDQIVVNDLDTYYKQTIELLHANRSYLDQLVSELMSKRVLYSSDIAIIVAPVLVQKGN